jgi:hypothetical protein
MISNTRGRMRAQNNQIGMALFCEIKNLVFDPVV